MPNQTPASLFEPIGTESVADAVVSQIEEMIAAGILKQGRRLPSERDLADAMGISRPKLREALQTLEERNLVQTRHGEGTFIAPLTGRAMLPALLALYERHGCAFFDYLEYRREQEGFAARLAAERATDTDRERLRTIATDLQTAWDTGDAEASKAADFQLHSAIVDASQNATLIHMMASIYELTRQGVFYNRDYLKSIDGTGRKLLEQHLALIDAVVEGRPDEAQAVAQEHMDFVEQSFRVGIERRRRETLAEKRRLLAT